MEKNILLISLLGLFGYSASSPREGQPIYSSHTSKSAAQLSKCMSPKWQELYPQATSIETETGYRTLAVDDLSDVPSMAIIQDDTEGGANVKVYATNKGIDDPWGKIARSCIQFVSVCQSHVSGFLIGVNMQEIMTRIGLGGVLGKVSGRIRDGLIRTITEAISALSETICGFEQHLNTSKNRGLTHAVLKGKRNIGKDDLGFLVIGEVVKTILAVIGNKKVGLLQTVLGAVFIVVGALGATIGQAWGGAAWGPAAMRIGAAMMPGGVVQALSPQPAGFASKQDTENRVSYAFGGVTSTTAQGNPVPLLCGRRRIDGAIISTGIYVEDQQQTVNVALKVDELALREVVCIC